MRFVNIITTTIIINIVIVVIVTTIVTRVAIGLSTLLDSLDKWINPT